MAIEFLPKDGTVAYADDAAQAARYASSRPWILSGLSLSVPGLGLAAPVSDGFAWIAGYVVALASESIPVPNSATSTVYLGLVRDGNGNVTNVTFATLAHSSGDYVVLGTVTASGGNILGVDDTGRSPEIQVEPTGVTTIFGRTGAVTAEANDYTADQIADGIIYKRYSATEQTKLSGIETAADVTDAGNVGSSIHGATGKTTPVDNDTVGLIDSAASNGLKKVTWANVKGTLKTYFDTLYVALTGNQSVAGIKTFGSFPITPSSAPTTDYQMANKKYVDDRDALGDPRIVTRRLASPLAIGTGVTTVWSSLFPLMPGGTIIIEAHLFFGGPIVLDLCDFTVGFAAGGDMGWILTVPGAGSAGTDYDFATTIGSGSGTITITNRYCIVRMTCDTASPWSGGDFRLSRSGTAYNLLAGSTLRATVHA